LTVGEDARIISPVERNDAETKRTADPDAKDGSAECFDGDANKTPGGDVGSLHGDRHRAVATL